jgi:xanthine/uracil permease
MDLHVNVWAVLLASVSSMVIGMAYYAPALLGKTWRRLAKIDEKRFQKEMPRVMPGVFLAALVTAYCIAYFSFLYHYFFADSWLAASVMTALLLWVGVSATTLFVHNALDQRPAKLTVISMGNRLLSLLAMGLILGWLHP